MNKTKNKIVLLSGGLDSTTLGYLARKPGKSHKSRVFSLTFDYGQRHKKELKSAKKIAKKIGSVGHKIVKLDLTLFKGSSLTDKKLKVPKRSKAKNIPNTYVPARNTIFLSFALAYAESINADEIYIGVNAVDYSGYVDCRPIFIKHYQDLANVATVKGVYKKPIKIQTPLIYLSKAKIIKLGQKLGVDWSLTWSCYEGKKLACGKCDSCKLRLKGFREAGIRDPLKYKSN